MIKLQLLDQNPLSLQVVLADVFGLFKKYNVDIKYEMISFFPAFDMTKVNGQVGDVTRVFERIADGEEIIITGDLSKTMKLILIDGYQDKDELTLLASPDQSLGIYNEFYCSANNIKFKCHEERSIAKRVELLKNKRVDGAFMIDPFLFEFIGIGYELVYDGKSHPDNYTCWAFDKSFLNNNKEMVLNFHHAINEGIEKFNKLSKGEKLKLAKEHLNFEEKLNAYYEELFFDQTTQYSDQVLKRAFKWKCSKNSGLHNINIEDIILLWN